MEADTDEEACEIASGLLLDCEFQTIEVWKDSRLVYRVAKVGPD